MTYRKIILAVCLVLLSISPALAQIVSVGSASQLTSGLSSLAGQKNPKVAFDGTNTYLVVWEEGANAPQNLKQIYAARVRVIDGTSYVLDASGIHLASVPAIQECPKVAYGGGVFLVVWQELLPTTDYDIKGVTVDPNGTVSSEFGISTANFNQVSPDLTFDASNNRFFVVWASWSSNNYHIYGARVGTYGSVIDKAPILMVDSVPRYAAENWDFVLYNPVIGCNGQKLLLAFSEKDVKGPTNFGDYADEIAYMYSLDGTNKTTVSAYDNWTVLQGYPEYGASQPTQMKIATDGTDFMWFYKPSWRGAQGYVVPKYFIQAAYVQANGTMPNKAQISIDSYKYATSGDVIFADPYYYVFYEGIDKLLDNYNTPSNPKFGSVRHGIYAGRLNRAGTIAPDKASPVLISGDNTATMHNPAAAKGAGADVLVVYEEDDNPQCAAACTSVRWGLKYRLVTVSTLVQDGGPTPEQLAIFLPSSLPQITTATVRYKKTKDSAWTTGHPLFRVQPNYADGGQTVDNGFAWTIFGLPPGNSYNIEVTTHYSGADTVYNAIMSTRALPETAGAPTRIIAAGTTSTQIQSIFDSAVAGDVIQFANGIYPVSNLKMSVSGTASQPIYIRGQSRTGVVLSSPTGVVLTLNNLSNVIVENITIQGSGMDSGLAASSRGILYWGGYAGSPIKQQVTVRNVTLAGVDRALNVDTNGQGVMQMLVYDNTFEGNDSWTQDHYAYSGSGAPGTGDGTPDIDQNIFWNDDGIQLIGWGNCAFNNTLSGFGDSLTMENGHTNIGNHFYRNDIKMSGDDAIEADYGLRNITFYDNRVENAMTLLSLDPLWGGPFIGARNIGINIGRQAYKLNNTNTGMFLYNNTVVRTANPNTNDWAWTQPNVGTFRSWGFQNNILVYQGATNHLLAMEPTGQDPIDFTHNSWYPDGSVWWSNTGGSFSSLASAQAGLSATTPIFSGSTHRHTGDNILESNPFTTPVVIGYDHHIEITTPYIPILADGTAAKNSGVPILGITDGFWGSDPDRGAIISGIQLPIWGDRSPNN